jgi:hypothetical protein
MFYIFGHQPDLKIDKAKVAALSLFSEMFFTQNNVTLKNPYKKMLH